MDLDINKPRQLASGGLKRLWNKIKKQWKSLLQILCITIILMIAYIIAYSDLGKILELAFWGTFLKDHGFRILIICPISAVVLLLFWNWFQSQSRARKILLTALIEIIAVIVVWHNFSKYFNEEPWVAFLKGNGIWTLITLLLSAPVAFVVWHFRDENTVRQLENQRKDVNLKEFQKIAEWVSGLHLTEDKITEKNKSTLKGESAKLNEETETVHKSESAVLSTETETTREYGQAGKNRHIRTPSREDGTAGLQVAAVYMLRPFFCGEHGDSFREPALNLLTATWLALFKPIEQQFKEAANANEQQRMIKMINEIVASPLVVALNQVLLADEGKPLSRFPHIFPNLYLPGLQLNQPGVGQQVKTFWQGKDCSGIQLWGADLQGTYLQGANLQGAYLQGAKLQRADLQGADLQGADLQGAKLQRAYLQGANLQGANLQEANLQGAKLQGAVVLDTDIDHSKELQNVADLIVLVAEQQGQIYELTFEGEDVSIDVTSVKPINLEATWNKNPKWTIKMALRKQNQQK